MNVHWLDKTKITADDEKQALEVVFALLQKRKIAFCVYYGEGGNILDSMYTQTQSSII